MIKMMVLLFTGESFHPGALVDAQVVVDDLQDVPQQSVHVRRNKKSPPGKGAQMPPLQRPDTMPFLLRNGQ